VRDLLPAPQATDAPRSRVASGVLGAAGAAAAGLTGVVLLVVLGWASEPDSGVGALDAVAAGVHGWLLAHHVPVALPGGVLGLVPAGLTLLPFWLLLRAGRALAREQGVTGPRDLAALAAALAWPYASFATVVALLARSDRISAAVVPAVLGPAVLAFVAGGVGAARQAGRLGELGDLLRPRLREACAGAAAAAALLLGAGALLAAGALAIALPGAADISSVVAPGIAGAVGLLVLGLLLVPNAVVWAAAYLTGPGFAVGEGTQVAISGTTLGVVPALPMLAALPAEGTAAGPLLGLLAVPVLAGVVAGLVVVRRDRSASRGELRRRAAWAGVLAGVALGGLAALTSGPAGAAAVVLGPSAWSVGAATALPVSLVATVTVTLRGRPRTAERTSSLRS
jgi:hypothetical protein